MVFRINKCTWIYEIFNSESSFSKQEAVLLFSLFTIKITLMVSAAKATKNSLAVYTNSDARLYRKWLTDKRFQHKGRASFHSILHGIRQLIALSKTWAQGLLSKVGASWDSFGFNRKVCGHWNYSTRHSSNKHLVVWKKHPEPRRNQLT